MGLFRFLLIVLIIYLIFKAIFRIGKVFFNNIDTTEHSKNSNSNKKGKITIIKGKEKKKIIPDGYGEYVDYEEV